VINEVCKTAGFIFMTYDQYMSGAVMKQSQAEALKKFEEYLLERALAQGDGLLRTSSVLAKMQLKPVTKE
jgi:hypothetical protein